MAGILKTVTPFLRGAGHFCVGQLDYERANEEITLKVSAGDLTAGTPLGVITGAATLTSSAAAGNVGNGAMGAATADAAAPEGPYRVVITAAAANAGSFNVYKPDGSLDGAGTVAVAYNGTINFTLADGATDFAVNDSFTILNSYTETYATWNPIGVDGSQNFGGILWDDRPNVAATQRAVATVREATVNANALTGWSSLSSANKAALVAAAKARDIIILV